MIALMTIQWLCIILGLYYIYNGKIKPDDPLRELKLKAVMHHHWIGMTWFGFALVIILTLYIKG
jgi:hypothetical protein